MINEQTSRSGKHMQGCMWSWTNMKHYLNIYLERLTKSHKTCQNSQYLGMDLKLEPIKHKAATLIT
jgi:hypothetical protein